MVRLSLTRRHIPLRGKLWYFMILHGAVIQPNGCFENVLLSTMRTARSRKDWKIQEENPGTTIRSTISNYSFSSWHMTLQEMCRLLHLVIRGLSTGRRD